MPNRTIQTTRRIPVGPDLTPAVLLITLALAAFPGAVRPAVAFDAPERTPAFEVAEPARAVPTFREPPVHAPGPPSRAPRVSAAAGPAGVDALAEACREWAERDPSWLGVPGTALAPARTWDTPRRSYVHFRQRWGDEPVLGTRLTFQFDDRGTLVHVRTEVFSQAALTALGDRQPRGLGFGLAEAEARNAAREGLPEDDELRWTYGERAWLPTAAPDGSLGALVPVWHLRFSTSRPPGDWLAVVDASSGELLARSNELVHSELQGRIAGAIEPASPGDDRVEVPFPRQNVFARLPGGARASTRTDSSGTYILEIETEKPVTWQAEMRGSGAWIRDASRALATPLETRTVVAPQVIDLQWNDDNSSVAARDAYHHATRAYAFVRTLDPGEALDPLDEGVELRVDDPSGVGNAFWNGTYLNFYAGGQGYAATARIADVVYHEYAHAVTHNLYFPFLPPRDMNEAWSDYFAASLSDTSIIGRGLLGHDTFLRELETDRVWPDHAHPDPHIQGLILASALWNLRTELGTGLTDSLFHYSRYGLSMSFDEYLVDLLLYDDDDGDLSNGSPHFDTLIDVFRAHGIGDYSVRISAAALPDVEAPEAFLEAEAHIDALLGLDTEQIAFYYAIAPGGPFERVAAVPSGAPSTFRAQFPAPATGTEVHYYWTAADTAGHQSTLPPNAPEATETFYVGPDLLPPEIEHVSDPTLTDDRTVLTLRADIRDNSGRMGPVRVEYRPEGGPLREITMVETGSAGTDSEARRYEGDLPLEGLVAGEVLLYRIVARDEALSPNTRTEPPDGDFRIDVRRGRTFLFEDDAGPFEPEGTWSWGVPADPIEAWSGSRVWATNLDGVYADSDTSELELGPFDLAGYDRATLQFEHLHRFEAGFDGGRVLASTDGGGTWAPLTPSGGYPYENVSVFRSPGFSGVTDGWERVEFPLDAYVGRTIRLRWIMVSDPFVTDLGWYLDDVVLIERQTFASPLGLRVQDGENERVILRWEPPLGVDTESSRFLGYVVYRALEGEPLPSEPLTDPPLKRTEYIDTDVVNDVTYRYRIVAAYDEGQSPGLEATATPAAPALGFDVESVHFHLQGMAQSDTTFFIQNLAGGRLEFDVFLGESDWSIEDARVTADLDALDGGDGEPTVLVEDPRDANGPADLHQLTLARIGDLAGSRLRFGVSSHQSWVDPLSDFGGVLLIDTDRDLNTSQDAFSFGWDEGLNIGWEYAVLFGRLPREFESSAPALLFAACCPEQVPTVLTDVDFPENADRLEFSVPMDELGFPSRVQVSLLLTRRLGEAPFDRVPENPDLPWLVREPRHGRARPDRPQPFSLEFDATEIANGEYAARFFLETNDQNRRTVEVPVTLVVSDVLPENPDDLRLDSLSEGMDIHFASPVGFIGVAAEIERLELEENTWRRLTPEPIEPDSAGAWAFLDRTAEPGKVYRYRIRILFERGETALFGPYQLAFDPPVPQTVGVRWTGPNPFSEVASLRLALPRAADARISVHDLQGRRVRELHRGELRAGFHPLSWDGANDRGRSLPSGIYFVRFEIQDPQGTEERVVRVVKLR